MVKVADAITILVFGAPAVSRHSTVIARRVMALPCEPVAARLHRDCRMSEEWTGSERRLQSPGRRASDAQRERNNKELRREVTRLKAVVEILADAVQNLTALQHKPNGLRLKERLALTNSPDVESHAESLL